MPSISGLASGMDTDQIIDKLVKIESQPIKRLEAEIKERQAEQKAWNKIMEDLRKLQNTARGLYSYNNPFGEKAAESSHPDVLSVKANRYAEPNVHSLKVLQLAANHKISSDSLAKDFKIKEGNFTIIVNKIKVKVYFPGGLVQDLFNLINEKAQNIVTASLVKKSDDEFVLTLQTKTTGTQGAIDIKDPDNVLRSIGIHKIKEKKQNNWSLPLAQLQKIRYENLGKGYLNEDFWFWLEQDRIKLQEERTGQSANSKTIKDEDKKKSLFTLRGSNQMSFPLGSEVTVDSSTKLLMTFRADFIPEQKKSAQQKEKKIPEGKREIKVSADKEINVGGNEILSSGILRKEQQFFDLRENIEQKNIDTKTKDKKNDQQESDKSVRGIVRIHLTDGKYRDYPFQTAPIAKKLQIPGYQAAAVQLQKSLMPLKGKKIQRIEILQSSGVASIQKLTVQTPKKNCATFQK